MFHVVGHGVVNLSSTVVMVVRQHHNDGACLNECSSFHMLEPNRIFVMF